MIRKPSLSMLTAAALALVMLWGCQSKHPDGDGGPAYFKVTGPEPQDTLVIMLKNPDMIAAARAIAGGQEQTKVHVTGLVVPGQLAYNAPWHFYVDPDSISFFEMAIEVCDAATTYVEAHLDEVGGSFLPGRRWCPWSSKVSEEIPAP